MTGKKELIEVMMTEIHCNRREAEKVIHTFLNSISESLSKGEHVELRGFGSFRVRHREPRMGRNPRTGVPVEVPAKKIAFFTPGKNLKDSINR